MTDTDFIGSVLPFLNICKYGKLVSLLDLADKQRKYVKSIWLKHSDVNKHIDAYKTTRYFTNDKLHREYGPTIIYANGNKHWYINGERHRENGPAVEYANGDKSWYVNDKRHRKDGPAIEWLDTSNEWWYQGKLHREDGPAIEHVSGRKSWWINGKRIK